MQPKDFYYSQEHMISPALVNPDVEYITNYDELLNAITNMISLCRKKQTFYVSEFSSDIEQQIEKALDEVLKTPLGSYAVQNVFYKSSLILSYYEVTFNATYNCTEDNLNSMRTISNKMELKLALSDGLSSFSQKILLYTENYKNMVETINDTFLDVYLSNPLYAMYLSDFECNVFPKNSLPYIVEVNVKYLQSRSVINARIAELETEIQNIVDTAQKYSDPFEILKIFHDHLAENTVYDETVDVGLKTNAGPIHETPFSIYGALIEKNAVSEAYALAMKELCDRRGITCVIVTGKRNDLYHVWNRVYVDSKWYNIDVSADSVGNGQIGYKYFCVSDETLLNQYELNNAIKNQCNNKLDLSVLEYLGITEEMLLLSRYD